MYETPRKNDRAGGEQHVDCLEAREQFPAMVDGTIGLSEWAPVEVHVGKCVNCRKLLDRLYSMKPRNEPERARASTRPVEPPDESTRILEVAGPARRSPPRAFWVSIVAVALMLGAAWGIVTYGSRVNLGSLVALLEKVRPESRQADIASAPPRPAPPPEVVPPSSTPPLESAPTPPPPVSAPEPRITAPAKAAPARPPASPSPPVSAPEPKITASAKAGLPASPSPPASLPSRVGKPPRPTPSSDAPTAKPPEPAIDPSALVEAGKIDVAVQLSVRNRKDAERDLGMLLTRVGGTKFGSGQSATLMASVPRSSYSEFTRGLTQIGSWQLEAGRSSLPDPVHVAVKLAK